MIVSARIQLLQSFGDATQNSRSPSEDSPST